MRTKTETKVRCKARRQTNRNWQTEGRGSILKVQVDRTHLRRSTQAGLSGGSQVREKRDKGTLPWEACAGEDRTLLGGRIIDCVGPDLRQQVRGARGLNPGGKNVRWLTAWAAGPNALHKASNSKAV